MTTVLLALLSAAALAATLALVSTCRHRHMTRAFTIAGRTYKVCTDCGREFPYSWAKMAISEPAPAPEAAEVEVKA